MLYGIEAGYNFNVSLLTVRPQVGVGNYTRTASSPDTTSYNESSLYLEPGLTGVVSFGQWIVGADANVLLLPGWRGRSQPAFTAHGQVSIKF